MPRWKRPSFSTSMPSWAPTVLPLLGYLLIAIVFLGRSVVLHPRSEVLGDAGPDKTIYMWSFAWWPWAIAHGHDPFDADVIWAPHGIDLAWVTAVPGASFLLTPFTETLGPVFAYNLAAIAAPTLAAWAAFLLARKLTGQVGPALVAGFIFGFSSYMLGQSTGHLNLMLVFLVPIAALLALTFLVSDIGRWRYAVLLGVVLTFQFLFSNEIFLTLTVVAGIAWLIARWQLPDLRERLRELALHTLLAYCIAAVLLLPYLAHAFVGDSEAPRRGHARAAADVLNYVVPTRRTWLRPPKSEEIRERFTSHGAEQGAYLGLPLIAIIGLSLFQRRRRVQGVVLWSGVAVAVAALGPRVRVGGREVGEGIWKLIDGAPFVRYALPIRLTMYVALFAALACALWLAAPGRRRTWRWALAGLAVITLLPNPSGRLWAADVPTSTFFSSGAYRDYVSPGDTVLALPYGPAGWTMLWQAESNFRFKLVGGHVGHHIIRSECRWYWDYRALAGVDPPGGAAEFRRFLIAHDVAAVIEGPRTPPKIRRLIAASLPDVSPRAVDDAVVRRLGPSLPAKLPANAPPLQPVASAGKKPKKRKLPPECVGVATPSSTGTAGSR
jgi:hypothetical protein